MSKDYVFAFDVYGTLIDTAGLSNLLTKFCPQNGKAMVELWRNKQLEYSFRQTAMGMYRGFNFCTKFALDYTCRYFSEQLSKEQKQELLDSYKKLPVFDDTVEALRSLSANKIYAFSNGVPSDLKEMLDYNNITKLLTGIISVETTQHFKPSPETYEHFNAATSSTKDNTILVSSNPFDIIGASYHGFKTIWVQRSSSNIFDTWDIEPDFVINNLTEISNLKL